MLHSELVPAADKNSRPWMVLLHGLGDSLDGWRWFPEAMNLPWLNYLLVNAPDDYYGGFSWFNLGEVEDMVPGVQRSRKMLFDLLDDLRAGWAGGARERHVDGDFAVDLLDVVDEPQVDNVDHQLGVDNIPQGVQ